MPIVCAARSDVGRKRGHNEDAFAVHAGDGLVVVADGVGGGRSGEVASRLAVETLSNFFRVTAVDPEVTWPFKLDPTRTFDQNRLWVGIQLANRRVREAASSDGTLEGMSTTIVALAFGEKELTVAHVGDSRAYRVRGDTITQLTEDHSLLNDYRKMKTMTPEELEVFPYKNVIVRALGMKDEIDISVSGLEPASDDVYLLCSDGLSGLVRDREIVETILDIKDLDRACAELVDRANAHGGHDNITVVLARY